MTQIDRILRKLAAKGCRVNAPATPERVTAFEAQHGIDLPLGYRDFLLTVADGGSGPPDYGLSKLGRAADDMSPTECERWMKLPYVRSPFPFTKAWVWENGEVTDEGTMEQIEHGSILVGNDGCGQYWHLIVTGPDRGIPWLICGEGIGPVCPKRDFLTWYEDWLDGRDSFYGHQHDDA